MTSTISPNHSTCRQCQERRYHTLPTIQKDNNSMLLLRSELGQLRDQLNKKNRQLDQQQLDMEQLNNKYVGALDQVSTIQHEKDLAERELEDLTCRLFEQANMMVANEKREVYRLRTELDRKHRQLEVEQRKYKQLLRDQQDISVSSSTSTSSTTTAVSISSSNDLNSSFHGDAKLPTTFLSSLSSSYQHASSFYSPRGCTTPRDDTMIMDMVYDQQHIQLFQQFIQTLGSKSSLTQHKQHPFMKQCLVGDIEPCLNFGSNNRLQSIKKMIDSMMQQPCLLEEVRSPTSPTTIAATTCIESDTPLISSFPSSSTSSPSSLTTTAATGTSTSLIGNTVSSTASSIGLRWSRFVSPGVSLVDCAGCGNTLNMQHYHRFRLNDGGGASENDWLHLDTPCRDRLKAVCTFFRFMRQQAYSASSPPTTTTTNTTTTTTTITTMTATAPMITTTRPTEEENNINDQHHQQMDEQDDDVLGLGSSKQSDRHLALYMEMTQLRLAMFYARLGIKPSCCWTDDDTTSVSSTQGPMTPVSSVSRQTSSNGVPDEV
ncbi:hypothetical protein BCR42DRAFT_80180 [Absidia repens]|uniref:GDP/GTP exchange factor Sec2 N-terminal domain-containing protein n=1 Tax=Absidia repens TaxID=90262 RepID=A0A1X2I9G1_9FUNG|nr:hypothetical protein BCR42DRAFT_80180 [Absidia repens]